jgi:hypothetical protein
LLRLRIQVIAVAEIVRVLLLVLRNGGEREERWCEPRHGHTRGGALAGQGLFARRTIAREFDAAETRDRHQIQGSADAGTGEVGDGDQRRGDEETHLARIVRNGGNGRQGLQLGCGELERAQRRGIELPSLAPSICVAVQGAKRHPGCCSTGCRRSICSESLVIGVAQVVRVQSAMVS